MVRAQSGIYPSEQDWDVWEYFPAHDNAFDNPWVPVRHHRGEENRIGSRDLIQTPEEGLSGNPISVVALANTLQTLWPGDRLFQEFPATVRFSLMWHPFNQGMIPVEAVNKIDGKALFPQDAGNVEKSQWLCPEIVS